MVISLCVCDFFVFKQKTAYEMRISDWSSDVCSSDLEERNAYLQTQISQVDTKIKEIEELDRQKSRLLARKEVIEQLQANRSQMVHLFDSLVRTIPDGV